MSTVAFLGLGRMGGPMTANVAKAGLPVVLYNRTRNKAETLAAEYGLTVVDTPREAAAGRVRGVREQCHCRSHGQVPARCVRLPESTPTAFAMSLAAKDLGLIRALAEQVGVPVPQAVVNHEVLKEAIAAGLGDRDMAAVAVHLRTSVAVPRRVG